MNLKRRGILLWIWDKKEILKRSGSKGWTDFTAKWDSHCDCIPKYRVLRTN